MNLGSPSATLAVDTDHERHTVGQQSGQPAIATHFACHQSAAVIDAKQKRADYHRNTNCCFTTVAFANSGLKLTNLGHVLGENECCKKGRLQRFNSKLARFEQPYCG